MLNKIFRKAFLLVLAVSFLFGTQVLTSCDLDSATPSNFGEIIHGATIEGTWTSVTQSGTDKYAIGNGILTYSFKGTEDHANYKIQYAGTIVGELTSNPSLFSAEHGYIIIKLTDVGDNIYDPKKTVGNYYVNHWKNLTSGSIELASAYKSGGKANTATLTETISEFTVDNGYFDMYGAYEKELNN